MQMDIQHGAKMLPRVSGVRTVSPSTDRLCTKAS